MRAKDRLIIVVCVLAAVGLLIGAASRLDYINARRQEMQLVSNEPLENAPPSLAFATVAMGAFRGLVVDILWIRADKLKEEGQFFDARQLAEWITTLQPRFAAVWEFHAWNMAYNISVAIPASQPDERWRWVKNGLELLRDKGIPKNPHSMKLYRQLAWIFQHKIGGVTDDAHKHYKLQIAMEMRDILGEEFTNETFERLAESPKGLEGLRKISGITEFISELEAGFGEEVEDEDLAGKYLALRRAPGQFDPNAFAVIDEYRTSDTLKSFDWFARAYVLRNKWKMEPELMIECNRKYGPWKDGDPNDTLPLNWEHADAHAIYWAQKGLEVAGSDEYSIDELNADRIVYHSLQSLYRTGKLIIYNVPLEVPEDPSDPENSEKVTVMAKSIFLRPDLRMFDPYDQATRARIEKYEELGGNVKSLENGHRNMLKNAVLSFYQAGQMGKAKEIYNELRKLYPREEFEVGLTTFARNRLREELDSLGITDAREIIVMMLREAYFRYAIRDDDQAYAREKMVEEVYENYQAEFADEGVDRVTLPPLRRMRFVALIDFLNDPSFPPNLRQQLLNRIEIERPELYEQLEKERESVMQELKKQQEQESENENPGR